MAMKQSRARALLERLERHPEMLERFESIMDLADSGQIDNFDEVEKLLADEVRQLGGQSLETWLEVKEREVGTRTQSEVAGTQQREKKL